MDSIDWNDDEDFVDLPLIRTPTGKQNELQKQSSQRKSRIDISLLSTQPATPKIHRSQDRLSVASAFSTLIPSATAMQLSPIKPMQSWIENESPETYTTEFNASIELDLFNDVIDEKDTPALIYAKQRSSTITGIPSGLEDVVNLISDDDDDEFEVARKKTCNQSRVISPDPSETCPNETLEQHHVPNSPGFSLDDDPVEYEYPSTENAVLSQTGIMLLDDIKQKDVGLYNQYMKQLGQNAPKKKRKSNPDPIEAIATTANKKKSNGRFNRKKFGWNVKRKGK